MNVLLLYDIEHDGVRAKVADACLDYGLDRIQYSAYIGRLSRNHQEEMMMRIDALITKGTAKVQLIRLQAHEWEDRLEICHA